MRKLLTRVFAGAFAVTLIGGTVFGISNAVASENEADKFFSATENAEVFVDYQAPEHIGDYKGIFVKAKDNGDSAVTLNHELDLRVFTANDVLLRLIPITTEPKEATGDLQVNKLTIRLTDVADENCFVEMSVHSNPEKEYPYASYASAYGNGQISTGRFFNKDGTIRYFSASSYGREVYTNFYGRARNGVSIEKDLQAVSFAYDYDTSCVHTDPGVPFGYVDTVIADLKDSENMKGEWKGFKSGKVKMTITASSETFANKDAGFMILNFGGLDFSEESWTDTEKPFFKIDTLGYDFDALPEAEVFAPYPVYEAIAFDKYDCVYGSGSAERELTVTVRKEGSTEPIPVKDGYFVPSETGVYEICYLATDTAGNVAEQILKIKANNVSPVTHTWVTPLAQTATLGVKTLIPEHEIDGVYGDYEITTVVYENTTGKEVEIKNGGFVAEKNGVYVVSVTVKDFVGRGGVFNYYVTAQASKLPILDTTPTIPRLMILGKEISLPDFEAYDYYSLTNKKMSAEKYYVFKNADGEALKKVKPGEKFTPDKSFGESIVVEYVAKSYLYEDTVGDSVSVTILDKSGTVDFSKYFVAENVTKVEKDYSNNKYLTYFFDTDAAKIVYGLPLPFNGMEFSFRVPGARIDENGAIIDATNNYDTIKVTLVDGSYSNKKVELAIKASSDPDFSDFYLNGEKVGKMYGTFDDTKLEDFLLRINGRNEIIDESGNLVCQITNYATGEAFEGFTDNMCYAEFAFENVGGGSAIQFVKNGSQYFSAKIKRDSIEPLIVTCGEYLFEQAVGVITLPGAVAIDAICGRTDVYLEVYTEDEDLVYRTKVGTSPVSFTLKSSGKYFVKYVSTDDSYNTGYNENVLSVYRVEPFEVTLSGEVPATAKKGDKITLPAFSVDSSLAAYDAVVFVNKPRGGQIEITESLTFTADQVGEYKVYYYVVYEVENSYLYELIEYSIMVK